MYRHCAFLVPGDWLTPTGGYRYDRQIILGLRAAGWAVRHLPIGSGFPRPTRAELAQADRALAELPEGTLTVIDGLAFGAMPELAARHARRLALVALVHHPLHLETGLDEEQRGQMIDSERRALACAAGVIVPSPATSRDVQALGVPRERIAVVEPGVLLQRAHARRAARAPTAHDAALRLLCVATLVPRKGHDVLLQALSRLQDRRWTLDCVGSVTRDPHTAQHLAKLAHKLGLQERVRWHGEVAEPALHACYREADVFVLPSHHEGYGMVIQEALAHGLPVIATTAGALRDTLPSDAGLHVPPGDAPALAEALAALMDSSVECARLREGARRAKAGLPTWNDAAMGFARALGRIAAQGAEAPEGQGSRREPGFSDGERLSASRWPPAQAVHAAALVEERAQGRFDGGWLALREPHDRAARSNAAAMGVVAQAHRAALAHAEARCAGAGAYTGREPRPAPTLRVIDLACGTGANLRVLSPALGGRQEWLVADHDAGLLAAWPQVFSLAGQRGEGRLGEEGEELSWRGDSRPGTARAFDARIRRLRIDLQREFDQIPFGEADLVTASALIDLASAAWIDRLVAACAKARFALLLALTVDGRWTWSPRDHFDGPVHAFFAAHQQRDKGFGPALGAGAAAYACDMAREAGLQVHTARSDWFLEGSRDEEMLGALIEGIAQAAIEQSPPNAAAIEGWRLRRQSVLARIRLRVGHLEVLVCCPARTCT